MKRWYRIIRYNIIRWLLDNKFKKRKPKCAICNKPVETCQEYAIIGEYRWWGVTCHGEYGVLHCNLFHTLPIVGKAFDGSNPKFEMRRMPTYIRSLADQPIYQPERNIV